jgi:hypothetical protein
MMTVPADFLEELRTADAAKRTLLEMEMEGLPWQEQARALLRPRSVVLFTGHRIDSPKRAEPRFPAEAEPLARAAIAQAVSQLAPALCISGGANGGDILFQEHCREAGIPTHMLLALPPEQFIAASVGDWVERFQRLLKQAPPAVLATSKTLPAWLAAKPGYDIWQRNNLWLIASALALNPGHFTLIALWDGQGGDGTGGTQHMVQVAQQHGARFIHLNTRQLFFTRSAKP